jgi:DNA-binding transcriptional MerR regulator
MREWLADIDEANLAEDVEPSVRSGNDPSGTETANLSEAERERKSELEAKLSELEEKEGPLAEKEQERLEAELAEVTGGDD